MAIILILLINSGIARKQKILPQTIIDTFKMCDRGGIKTQQKMMVAAKCCYLMVSLFCDLVRPFLLFILVGLSFLAALFALFSAYLRKGLCLSRRHSPYSARIPSGQVIFKQNILSKFSVQIIRSMVLF